MKQILLFVLTLLPMLASAEPVEIDGIYYNLISKDQKTAEVAKNPNYFDNYSGEVVIPEKVTYEEVEYSVTSIGNEAFYYCKGLTSIAIPNSVTNIGGYAFYYCSGLTSITIGNNVTSIGNCAFAYCSGLTSITIGNSVTSIGNTAFASCSNLTSITIPNSVTSIGDGAFQYCRGLTSITIPNSVTSIGNWALNGCSALTSIIVEDGNPNYDSRNNCNALIETSSNTLLNGCMNTTIPNGVTNIGSYAFNNCSGLPSVTIPNSVTSIGDYAFWGCSGLTFVTIPNSVTNIGGSVFWNCFGLTSIVVEDGNPNYDSRNNCNALIETSSNTLLYGCMNTTIPNSVTSIGDYAFSGCYGLTSINIPNSVTTIGDGAFTACHSLTSITIPNSITSIGKDAFFSCPALTSVHITELEAWLKISFGSSESNQSNPLYFAHHLYVNGEEVKDLVIPNCIHAIQGRSFIRCYGLTSVTIPNSVTSIDEFAFYECTGLTSIIIGSEINNIGYRTFAGCEKLSDVYCYAKNVPNTDTYAFLGSYPEKDILHVPSASLLAYKIADVWSKFGTIVALTDEDPKPTGIENVNYNRNVNNRWYSLDGQLLQGMPTQKGVYIVNGHKVVIK